MLFRPPGTGKSTLAHAIASGLGWPFLELFPARLAGERGGADATAVGVVDEMLKAIVRFRSQDGRPLVCATNNLTTLDPAFLRHGRFDYVLPIGPPDHTARTALWESYLARAGARADSAVLASANEGFTPADIARAARTVSQAQFERTFDTGTRTAPTTDDYLDTIRDTRATVSAAMAQEFAQQTQKFARI
ncbi:ATP-binding protein [Streptomyces sp. NPDC006372]|uniref:ATP-binding protein n=1 Tax=Streptomyces sp. NPDC006372 TaxID=3155599 RepID=UPI0033B3B678